MASSLLDATGFQYEECQGDLFSCPKDMSLAHCISEDIRMGKGIAVIFKKQFGGVDELRRQGMRVCMFIRNLETIAGSSGLVGSRFHLPFKVQPICKRRATEYISL